MKKTVISIIISLFCICNVFAVSGRVYFSNSREYNAIREMAQYQGITGPSLFTPISEQELYSAFKYIDRDVLPEYYKTSYDELELLFSAEKKSFEYQFDVSLTPQLLLASNKDDSAEDGGGRNSFFIPYGNEKPFLGINLVMDFGSFASIVLEAGLKNRALKDDIPLLNTSFLLYGHDNHWYVLNKDGVVLYDTNIPNLAVTSFGNEYLRFSLGRGKVNMGGGSFSNMLISDNFPYHEFAKLSLVTGGLFRYDIMLLNFDNQISETGFERPNFTGMHQRAVFHSFDFDIAKQIAVTFTLGTMLYTDNSFDLRWITPFNVLHNMFNYDEAIIDPPEYDEANNIMGFEVNWAIAPRFNIDLQLVIDQFQLFFEAKSIIPNALGGLIHLSYLDTFRDGSVKLWAEAAYTNPYLYLNEKVINGVRNYNYDWIAGYFSTLADDGAPNISYIGYQFGPDTLAFSCGISRIDSTGEYHLSFMYKLQGEKGIGNSTISGFDYKDAFSLTGTLEHHFMIAFTGTWNLTNIHQMIYGMNLSWYNNYLHRDGTSSLITQLLFGIKIGIM